jgi:hypothetical protein
MYKIFNSLEINSKTNDSSNFALKVKDSGGTEIISVRDDKKIGIGTSTPDSALHLVGQLTIGSATSAWFPYSSIGGAIHLDAAVSNSIVWQKTTTSQNLSELGTNTTAGLLSPGTAANDLSLVISNGIGFSLYDSNYTKTAIRVSGGSVTIGSTNSDLGTGLRVNANVPNNYSYYAAKFGTIDGGDYAYFRGDERVGIRTSNPLATMHIKNSSDQFYNLYLEDSGGTALAIMRDDGGIIIGRAANINLGNAQSMAIGYGATATGTDSTAVGYIANAVSAQTTAIGKQSVASASFATAIGNNNTASGAFSISIGSASNATSNEGIAIGYLTTVTGVSAVVIGAQAMAQGNYSNTLGAYSRALAPYSSVIGYSTYALSSHQGAIVMGYGNTILSSTTSNALHLGWDSSVPSFVFAKTANSYLNGSGNVGIGTVSPIEKLHVSGGTIRINTFNGTEGAGKLAVSDANGSISFSSTTDLGLGGSGGTGNYLPTSGGTMTGDINMTIGTVIKSTLGGGQLDLASYSTSGTVLLSNDNGAWTNQSQLYLSQNYVELSNYDTGGTTYIAGGYDTVTVRPIGEITIGNSVNGIRLKRTAGSELFELLEGNVNLQASGGVMKFSVSNHEIQLSSNGGVSVSSVTNTKAAVFIGSQSSVIGADSTNSIIIGGSGNTINSGLTGVVIAGAHDVTATASHTLYAQKMALMESGSAPLNFPIFTSNPPAVSNGDVWILSAATGNAILSVRIGGVTKTVELA